MKRMKNTLNNLVTAVQSRIATALGSNQGEGYVDTIVKMAIAVVLGALILTILLAIIGENETDGIMGIINGALKDLFS